MVEIATDVFSEKLMQAISFSANGIPLGHQLRRIISNGSSGWARILRSSGDPPQ